MIHFALAVYTGFAKLVLGWFEQGCLPDMLRGARQVHLPKAGVDDAANSLPLPVEKMRPLSIFCWWQLIGYHPAIRRWADEHAAIQQRDLFAAIRDLGAVFIMTTGLSTMCRARLPMNSAGFGLANCDGRYSLEHSWMQHLALRSSAAAQLDFCTVPRGPFGGTASKVHWFRV